MSDVTVNRSQRLCALCKYWNGAIGSTTIRIVPGGTMFCVDNREQEACFKPGKGIKTVSVFACPNFKPRYED